VEGKLFTTFLLVVHVNKLLVVGTLMKCSNRKGKCSALVLEPSDIPKQISDCQI
jgi:hypothetical protein